MSARFFSRALLSTARATTIAMAIAAPCNSAIAQVKDAISLETFLSRSEDHLLERDRNLMHLGNPLRILGVEQNGRDIRSETPALARSDRRAAELEPEALHRRAIGIYERGALFTEPTTPLSKRTSIVVEAPTAPGLGDHGDGDGSPSGWAGFLEWILVSIPLAWVLVRFGKALIRGISTQVADPGTNGVIRVPGHTSDGEVIPSEHLTAEHPPSPGREGSRRGRARTLVR